MNRTKKRTNHSSKKINIRFKTTWNSLAPVSKRSLSKNGPYIDTHFKNIDAKNPIGQTYYLRPITKYNTHKKVLTIILDKRQPTIHMNTNSVSDQVTYSGTIKN